MILYIAVYFAWEVDQGKGEGLAAGEDFEDVRDVGGKNKVKNHELSTTFC